MFTIGAVFWLLFIVGFVIGGFRNRNAFGDWFGDSLFWWVLILLLGIGTFGWPIK